MTSTYKTGDRVTVPAVSLCPVEYIDGPAEPPVEGVIVGPGHPFCTKCHCIPANPEHAGDASECCPGPHYLVRFSCPHPCRSGEAHEHVMTYAAHEITPLRHLHVV